MGNYKEKPILIVPKPLLIEDTIDKENASVEVILYYPCLSENFWGDDHPFYRINFVKNEVLNKLPFDLFNKVCFLEINLLKN